eukprot:m.331829 g.331829  ORF g.331829 m.331829 type:complete len:161 (-) comp55625_c0_seq5:35-517(-)
MLFFYHLFVPIQVLLTDYFAHTMDNLRFNIALNATAASCEVGSSSVDWHSNTTWPDRRGFDVVLGCDLVYDVVLVPSLLRVISHVLKKGGVFHYVCGFQRQGNDELIAKLKEGGFACQEHECPAAYRANPLVGDTRDEVDLHFNELEESPFTLLTFRSPR